MKIISSPLLYFYLFFFSLSFGTLKADSHDKAPFENYQSLFTAYQLFFIQSWQDPKAFQAASYVKTHLSSKQQDSCLNKRDDVCTIYFEENDLKYCDDLLKSWNYFSLVLDNNDKAYLNSKQSSHSLNLYGLTYSMERCADSGHLRSILALGKGNLNGTHNTEKNLLAAEYWFRFLISTAPQTKESYESAYFLGLILDEKDKEGALQWMEWAARKGNKSARKWLIQSIDTPNPNAYFAYIKIKDDRGENSLPFYKILYQNLHNKESSKEFDELKNEIMNDERISWDRRQRIQDIPLQKKELSEKANALDIIRRLSEALQKKDYELNAMTLAHLLQALIYFHNDAETLLGYNKSDAHSVQDLILKDIEDSLEKKRLSQGSSGDDKSSSYDISKDKELKRVLELISLGYKSHEKHKSHDSNYMEKLTKALYSLYGDHRNAPESFFDTLLESMDKTKNPRVLLTLLPDLLRGDLEKLDNLIKARDLFVAIQGDKNQNNDGLIEIERSIDILSSLGNLPSEAPELCQKNTIVELPSSFQKLQGLLCSKDKRDILRHFLLQGQSHKNSGFEMNFMNLPENVQEALGILGKWAAVKSHKQKTGFYKLSRALKMGFSKKGAQKVENNLKKKNQELHNALHEFNSKADKDTYLQSQTLEHSSLAYSHEESENIKNVQLKKLKKEKAAIELSLSRSQETFSHYLNGVFSSLQSLPDTLIHKKKEAFSVALPSAAKFESYEKTYLYEDHLAHHSIDLQAGDVLQMTVTGEWSPLCALRKSGYAESPSIGPEGFLKTDSKVHNEVSGEGSRDVHSEFTTAQVKASASVGAFYINPSGYSASLGIEASVTTGTSDISEDYKYKEESDSHALSIYFQSGLRLINTPFPKAPAGAYLAIIVPKETRGKILDIQVLQRTTTLIATEDASVFFIVNDCHNSYESKGTLSVSYDTFKGSNKKFVTEFIKKSIPKLRREGYKIIKEGDNTESRFSTLRSNILSALEGDLGASLYSEPQVKTLFDNWLNHEIDFIKRHQRLKSINHDIAILEIELKGLSQRQTFLEKAQCLTEEGIKRQESLTKLINLKYKASSLLDYINHYVLPFVDLYYDKDEITLAVRIKLRESESDFLSFTNPSYRHNYSDLGRDLFSLSTSLDDTLTLVNLDLDDKSHTDFVFLRIPKPGGESDQSPDNMFRASIDPDRAKIFWAHLFSEENKPPIAIHLHPSDLYHDNKQHGLYKWMVSPLILDVILIFSHKEEWEHDSTVVNDIDLLSAPFNVGPRFLMALEEGPEDFTLEEGSRIFNMGVGFNKRNGLFADSIIKIQSENRRGVNAGSGLSPFTQFQIDPDSSSSLHFLKDKLSSDSDGYPQDVTDAWLVFKIFAKNKKKNGISWLEEKHDH